MQFSFSLKDVKKNSSAYLELGLCQVGFYVLAKSTGKGQLPNYLSNIQTDKPIYNLESNEVTADTLVQ